MSAWRPSFWLRARMSSASGEEAANGNAAAVGHIPAQLEAAPVLPMSVTALLHAQPAVLRQAGEHFLKCPVLLALQMRAAS